VSTVQKGGKLGRQQKQKPAAKHHRKDGLTDTETDVLTGTVRVIAVADWAGLPGAMAFASGDSGELVYASDQGWLCVCLGERTGWVPADYWRIVTDVSPSLVITLETMINEHNF